MTYDGRVGEVIIIIFFSRFLNLITRNIKFVLFM